MNTNKENLNNASINELMNGYSFDNNTNRYNCLFCDTDFKKGYIYKIDECLVDAETAIRKHIISEHGSVYDALLNLDKELCNLSDQQKIILKYSYQGYSDQEIIEILGKNDTAIIRNTRSLMKKYERQAKITLVLLDLLNNCLNSRMVKKNLWQATIDKLHYQEVNADNLPIKLEFPKKEQEREIVLQYICDKFKYGVPYTEKEVNEIISIYYSDYVFVRRELVDRHLIIRQDNGSEYVLADCPEKDLKRVGMEKVKDRKIYCGILKLINKENGKVFIQHAFDYRAKCNALKFELNNGTHINKELQEDWNIYGEENFEISLLEEIVNENTHEERIKRLLDKRRLWIEKLKTKESGGYN